MTTGRVVWLRSVQDKLAASSLPSPQVLLGYQGEPSAAIVVVDTAHISADALSSPQGLQECLDLLPYGISVVGVWAATEAQAASAVSSAALLHAKLAEPLVAYAGEAGNLTVSAQKKKLEVQPLDHDDASWLQAQGVCVVRCRVVLTLNVFAGPQASGLSAGLTGAIGAQEQALSLQGLAFLPDGLSSGPLPLITTNTEAGTLSSLAPTGALGLTPLQLSAQPQQPGSTVQNPGHALSLDYQPIAAGGPTTYESAQVALDVLAYLSGVSPLAAVACAVHSALLGQLRAVERVMLREKRVVPVSALHFLPPSRSHHVTTLYPALSTDADLSETKLTPLRQRLHTLLNLPPNRPALRSAHALDDVSLGMGGGAAVGQLQAGPGGAVSRLQDVHATLPSPGIGGNVYLVDGPYEYYHYMQDRFNDAGWGCAYRSCQTICSWFQLNKYTRRPVPSHREIQATLVRLGDKPQSFVGSSNWIGAIELSYVLDDWLGVSCKIMTVNKGSDIPSHARQLAAHFTQHGTPVMIGGGVLAYTLLGVAFNELTGEAAFLILDPHYTGGEDLKKIHQGTWVAWKKPGDNAAAGGPLFVQDAFYNFLCPQRPTAV